MLINDETKNAILEKVKGSRIRTVGTRFDAYKRNFDNIYKNFNKIKCSKEGKEVKIFNEKNEVIHNFTSIVTFDQCFKTLVSLDFLEINLTGEYIPILKERSEKEIIDIIFSKYEKGNNQQYKNWINIYRQSKIIVFLIELKIIDENNINSLELKKLRSKHEINFKDFKETEIGYWDKEICSSIEMKSHIISKVLGHDFIKD